jgi:hypothetical protein
VSDQREATGGEPTPKIDTGVPQTARIWNYWLGGKDHYAVDREVGDQVIAAIPRIVVGARAQRGFLARAVRYLAGEVGIRQFLDVGTGLPTANNTHEVAQAIAAESRIVYVDFDPIVLAHARALLTSTPEGVTDYIAADARDTGTILERAAKTLDLTRPVGLMLLGVLGHVDSYDEGRSIVRRLTDALASGSYVAVADGTSTHPGMIEAARIWNQSAKPRYTPRSPEQVAGYLDGLELVDPGVVALSWWRPDPSPSEPPEVDAYGGVARKP